MNGRRTQTTLPDGTSWRYGYDRLSQVVSGERVNTDGNMLSNDGWTYVWNAQDRLASAAKGTTRLEFAYDYMGRRFEKKAFENNVLTKRSLYAYDGFKQIAEYDALDNNALLNTYLWLPEGLDVPLLRNGSEFYVSDANKNVVALMDTTGAVTDTYVYAPFGKCTHTGDSTNPFRFSSEYHDDETDLVYYNYRYYLPELGRWTKRDPIGEMGRGNIYLFVNNNCIILIDHYGLITKLGAKLWSFYLGRCLAPIGKMVQGAAIFGSIGAVFGGVSGRISNELTHSTNSQIIFEDSEGELVTDDKKSSFVKHIIDAVRNDAQKRMLTSRWQAFHISRTNIGGAYLENDDFFSARYLLANNSENYIQGNYQAKCKQGVAFIVNVSLDYEWYDEVDAHDFEDAYKANKVNSFGELLFANPANVIEVFLGDWIGDKALGGSYYVIVKGRYSRKKL